MAAIYHDSFVKAIVATAVLWIFSRLIFYSPRLIKREKKTKKNANRDRVSLMIFFGSGGHTTEMLRMIPSLNINRYDINIVLSNSDSTSAAKIESSEALSKLQVKHRWHRVYRSREVKQSWLTTIPTALVSLLHSLWIVAIVRPEVVLCNGPGTCVGLCYAAYFYRVLGFCDTYIIFVESFCRVRSLSATGKLLYPVADRFIVQWPGLATKYKDAEYVGVIC